MALKIAPIDPNEFATLNAIAHQNYAAGQQQAAPVGGGGNLLDSLIHGVISPFEWFGNTVFVNPIKELATGTSGNPNAKTFQQSSQNLGLSGKKATSFDAGLNDLLGGVKTVSGNSIGLATSLLAPEAKAGILPNLVQGAKIGALAGAGSSLANKGSAEDTLKGALEGALGGGVLGGAAGTLGKLTSKAADIAAGRAASTAAKQATEQAVLDEAPFKGINKTTRERLGLQGAIQNTKDLQLASTPESMRLAHDFATGSTGQGSAALDLALQGQKVNVGDYLGHVQQAIKEEPVIQSSTGQRLLDSITNNKENNLFNGKGSLTQNANAADVMKSIRYHEGQAARYADAAPGTEGDAIGKVHEAAANYLKGKLDANPEVNKAIAAYKFSPDAAAKFTEDVVKAGGTKELAQHIIDNINNAKSVADLRSFQAPFVRMGQLADAADTAAGGALTKLPPQGQSIGDTALNVAADLAFGSKLGLARNAASVGSKSGSIDKLFAGIGKVGNGAKTIASKIPATALPQAERLAGALAGQSASAPPSVADTTTPGATDSLTTALSGTPPQSSSPFDPANLQASIAQIVAGGGTLDDVTKFLSIASTLSQLQGTTQPKLSATQQQQAQNAISGLQDIQGIQQQIQSDPSIILRDSLPGGSLARRATGTGDYDAAIQNVKDVIARLRSGAALNAQEEQQYLAMLPTGFDSQEVALSKLNRLASLLGQFANPQPTQAQATNLIAALGGA